MNGALALYLHWPICLSKCPYCAFTSYPVCSVNEARQKEIGVLLLRDLQLSMERISYSSIGSIFFGGGTPSLMSPSTIGAILNYLDKHYDLSDIEISIEANPATFSREYLSELKSLGVNRLSLGIQSFQDNELRFLGRPYDGYQALQAAHMVSEVFSNYSFDFIYGIEDQSLSSVQDNLTQAMQFGVPHLSCYQLTFEENTEFFRKKQTGKIRPIDIETEATYYKFIEDFLASYDRPKYEISNFAASGAECYHNLTYWRYGDYLGVGVSAHSRLTIDGAKHALAKSSDLFQWGALNPLWDEDVVLTELDQLEEILLMGLRTTEGVIDLDKKISPDIVESILSQDKLNFLRAQGLLKPDQLCLTDAGMIKLDSIVEFLCCD